RSIRCFLTAAMLVPAASFAAVNTTTFYPDPATSLPRDARPPAPSFRGRLQIKSARIEKKARTAVPLLDKLRVATYDPTATMVDGYIQDGWASAVAISPTDATNVLVAFEEGWDFDPDIPLSSLRTGVSSWTSSVFPLGSGIYGGIPSQPWAGAGNNAGELYATSIRQDLYP